MVTFSIRMTTMTSIKIFRIMMTPTMVMIRSKRTQGLPSTTWWPSLLGWRPWQAYRFLWWWGMRMWSLKYKAVLMIEWRRWQAYRFMMMKMLKYEVIMMIFSTGKFPWAKGSALSSFGSFSETTACLAFRSFANVSKTTASNFTSF